MSLLREETLAQARQDEQETLATMGLEAYIASHRDGVQTEYWPKPIPDRSCDWAAWRDAETCTEYGPTEEAAIRGLLTWEWEHDYE